MRSGSTGVHGGSDPHRGHICLSPSAPRSLSRPLISSGRLSSGEERALGSSTYPCPCMHHGTRDAHLGLYGLLFTKSVCHMYDGSSDVRPLVLATNEESSARSRRVNTPIGCGDSLPRVIANEEAHVHSRVVAFALSRKE